MSLDPNINPVESVAQKPPTPAPVQVQQANPQNTQPTPPPQPQKIPTLASKLLPLLLVISALLFGTLIFVIIKLVTKEEPAQIVQTVVVTPTPSPTPIRTATAISTTSAYLELEKSVNEFSITINEFSKDDPMLNPPSLVLPLGF